MVWGKIKGCKRHIVNDTQGYLLHIIEISERIAEEWAVLAKRWVVERTFAWLNHFRRLSKDYEFSTKYY